MSSLLYYSISSDLTEDEIIEVDHRVAKDREAVYLFFRELPSNSKGKVKKLFNYGMFLFQLSQAVVPYGSSVMFPPPTGVTNIERIIDYEIRQRNNLENDQTSGKIIVQTGSVKILEVNNSCISYQDDELDFLESTTEDIILAKDTSSTGSSIFAEGFPPPLRQRPQRQGGQTATGLGGSNPGNGNGGSSSSDSLSNGGTCKWNRPAKVKEIPYNLQSAPKTKQQKALEKKKRELKESIEAEKELNAYREKLGKSKVIVMIKDGRRFFATHDQLRDKFHHARDLGSPIPIQDFLQVQKKSNNQYQLVKVKQFFKKLQTGILMTSFSDTHFQSLVAVPLVKFNKVQKFWVGQVWLAQELFYYKYPFYFPDLFQRKLTKDAFEVQVQVFKIFSFENIQKIFLIKEFSMAKAKLNCSC